MKVLFFDLERLEVQISLIMCLKMSCQAPFTRTSTAFRVNHVSIIQSSKSQYNYFKKVLTECVSDLAQYMKIIIFELLLTAFKDIVIF